MTSERLLRQIDRMLDEAEAAVASRDWVAVKDCCQAVLRVDPNNEDAKLFLQMAGNDTPVAVEPVQPTPASPAESPASEPPTPESAPAAEAKTEPEELPGSFVNGRYTVKKLLGEGGKKKVYLARDSVLDRDIAFALIKTEGLNDIGRERIKREAQAMGRMGTHPCIVPIYDLGEENNQPYMVIPLLSGGDVEGLIEKADGPLELERAIQIASQTAQGLVFAHSQGIVHRDLKPGNVWMDESGAAKIGDFGLAVATDRSRLTIEKVMVGTVSYMPPEQATGGEVTPKADLYSLGAMLYEMCAGRPPFVGDDEIAIITQHVNTPPVAPSWHNKAIPQTLDSLILRLMAKNPEERPGSAEEVFSALEAIDLSSSPARGDDADPIGSVAGGIFVGRRTVMDQLKAAFEEVISGSGRMVTLVGEPGIGKTRTAQELQTYAGMRGAQVLWGRSHEAGGAPPYWPWVQVIRTYVSSKEPDVLRRELGSTASVISEIVPDIRERLPEALAPQQIEDPESARFRLFDSVANFLRTASLTAPMVIILDDLHWADRPSLLLLEYVVKELRNSRLFIIGNYRDVELNRRHPLAITLGDLTRESLFERIHLDGLKQHDVRKFIEDSVGVEAPEPLVSTVFAQTEGNPLFLTETVNLLVQEGELTNQSNGRRTQSWELSIPESVREVVGRRLDKLSEECYTILASAAVIGRQFRLPVLEKLTSDLSEDQLLDLLDEALESRIIEEIPSEIGLYHFTDPMMQDALTEELSLTRRVRFHARIAKAIEEFWGDKADDHAAELAHHFGLAEAVHGTKELVHYLSIAGKQANDSFAYENAETHYAALLEALKEGRDDVARADAFLGLATAQTSLSRGPAGVESTKRAFDILVRTGATEKAISVARSMFPMGGGQSEIYAAAIRIAQPDSVDAVDLMAKHARSMFVNYKASSAEINEAIEKAEKLHDEPLIMSCVAAAASIDGMAGYWEPTLERSLRAIQLGKNVGDRGTEWLGHIWAANSYSATGDPAKAIEHNRQAIRIGEESKNRGWVGSALGGIARTDAFKGDWESAKANVDSTLKIDVTDDRAATVKVKIGIQLGDFSEINEPTESPYDDHLHYSIAFFNAIVALDTGDPTYAKEARARFDTSFPDGISTVDSWSAANHVWAILPIIESDKIAAETRLKQIAYWGGWVTHQGVSGDRLLGLLATVAGDDEKAQDHFEASIKLCSGAGYLPELAWSSANYAELLIASSRDSELDSDTQNRIDELQDKAISIATELKMKRLVERVLSTRELLKA